MPGVRTSVCRARTERTPHSHRRAEKRMETREKDSLSDCVDDRMNGINDRDVDPVQMRIHNERQQSMAVRQTKKSAQWRSFPVVRPCRCSEPIECDLQRIRRDTGRRWSANRQDDPPAASSAKAPKKDQWSIAPSERRVLLFAKRFVWDRDEKHVEQRWASSDRNDCPFGVRTDALRRGTDEFYSSWDKLMIAMWSIRKKSLIN